MDLRLKSRHLQLKGHQQAGREHSSNHIETIHARGAVRLGLRGLKMPQILADVSEAEIFLFGTFSLDGCQRKSTSKNDSKSNSQRQLIILFDP